MQETYNAVPNIVSSKDLDYLSDMFNWNYGAYKSNQNAVTQIQDLEIQQIVQKSVNIFLNNIILFFI